MRQQGGKAGRMTSRTLYQLSGLAIVVIAASFAYGAWQMRYFTSIGPGPGFFPLWLSIILGGLGLGMTVLATFSLPEPLPEDFAPEEGGFLRVLALVTVIAGTALALKTLGFAITLFFANLCIMAALGQRDPKIFLPVALLGGFGSHYLFSNWLNVPLPSGIFGF
jgi:putative tricarboxylic transport membrane protein